MAGLAGCSADADPPVSGPPVSAPPVTVQFTVPDEILGLPRAEDPGIAAGMAEGFARQVKNPTGSIAHEYVRTEGLSDVVSIAAVAGEVEDPAAALEAIIGPVAGGLNDVQPVDLDGGIARCGVVEGNLSYVTTACYWADEGSVGSLGITSLDMRDRRGEFPDLLAQFVSRG